MKKLLFAVLTAMVMTCRVLAGCDWATETPADDGKYKYFVAKSYSEISASDAAKKAEQDIDAQIGRLFGTKMDVMSEFYSDEISATGTTRSYERTIGAITLKGLERQKGDVEQKSKSWIGCVKYRYLKSEIESEKKRLKNMSASDLQKSLIFTEVAGDSTCKGAPVEIVTTPSGAYVTLDDGKYQGTSPIKFGNVCNGKHTLDITHDNYDAISQKLVVPTSGRISKTLVRSTKEITIRTSLGNSKIEINGVDKGKEPVVFKAQLGIEQTITAINSEAVKVTRARTFSKDSNSTYTIPMEKLPGKIDFTAFKKRNPGVEIFIDNLKVSEDTTKELAAYDHVIKFSKNGYNDIINTISVTGGETIYYPSAELNFEKYTPPVISTPTYKRSWLGYFFGLEYGSGYWGVNTGLEYQYRYGWFYADCSLLLSALFGSYETIDNYWGTEENSIDIFEYFRGSIGFNITHNTSLFGMISFGTFDFEVDYDYSSDYAYDSTSITRYGAGIGYTSDSGFGIKAYVLTGSPKKNPIPEIPNNVTTVGITASFGF